MEDDATGDNEKTALQAGRTSPRRRGEPPSQVGPYRLLELIGQGGMGEVWLAEQREPVRRRVALKLIKRGMDTRAVIARFEAERQALAMMDHPCIAKVLDAGETPDGHPYFVMEHVRGIPITEHCDKHRLNLAERLELLRQVCEGVQHAHQKAVIHRDLKPSNILVTIQDERALPKIIDFGVAKATAQRLTERTIFTELGEVVGTPEYMSPEQAEMSGQDIDTRTDVYALGVVLYELLVGALPFDSRELRKAGLLEMYRVIREKDPPRPSTRVTSFNEATTVSARARRTEPPKLARQLRGDLDWITMKALEKDRTRRYGSATELAADIGRYLTDDPIEARPPSTTYRVLKFVRRHRVAVAVATGFAVLLVAFSVALAFQAARIARERDRANAEADKAEAVSRFLSDTLSKSDPFGEAGKADLTVREALDQAARELDGAFADQPAVGATVRHTVGEAYVELDLLDRGETLLEQAYRERRQLYGDNPDSEAPDSTAHADLAQSLEGLAALRWQQFRDEEADALAGRAVAMRERLHGRLHPATADAIGLRGSIAVNIDEDRGIGYMREAIDLYERLGIDDDRMASSLQSLGFVLDERDPEESEALLRRSIEIWRHTYGPEHPTTLYFGELILAERIHVWGRARDAQRMMEPLVEPLREKLGERSQLADLYRVLGMTYIDTGEPERAIPHLEEAVAIYSAVDAADTYQGLDARSALAQARCRDGESAPALESFAELSRLTAEDGPSSVAGAGGSVRLRYAGCLHLGGRDDEARAVLAGIIEPEYQERKRAILNELGE